MVTDTIIMKLLNTSRIFFVFFPTPFFLPPFFLPPLNISPNEKQRQIIQWPCYQQNGHSKSKNGVWTFHYKSVQSESPLSPPGKFSWTTEAGACSSSSPGSIVLGKETRNSHPRCSNREGNGRWSNCTKRSHATLLPQPWSPSPMLKVSSKFYCSLFLSAIVPSIFQLFV